MAAVDLFTFVALFDKQLAATAHLLERGEAHAGAEILDWRLIGDMHPLRFQRGTTLSGHVDTDSGHGLP